MERSLYSRLVAWKSSPRRKPLLLKGARQTGKTWLLREFGAREFERVVYLDFEADPLLEEIRALDLNSISPLDALNRLYEWQQRFGQDDSE